MIKYLIVLLLIPCLAFGGTISGGAGAAGTFVSAAAAAGTATSGTPSTEQTMIAQWQFEESYADSTGITGALSASGSPSFYDDYPLAGSFSLQLTGTSSQYAYRTYANLSNYAPFKGAGNDFTICGMASSWNFGDVHYIFALFDVANNKRKIGILINTSGYPAVVHGNADGTSNESATYSDALGIGTKFAFVYTESVSTGSYALDIYNITAGVYLNTQLSGTWANTYNSTDDPDLTIGTRPGSSLYMTGIVDEIRVYNKILNMTERNEYFAYAASVGFDPEYGVLFATGFEGISLQSESSNLQYFTDDGLGVCLNNTSYCTVGDSDSSTGYNVPADMPGQFRVTGFNEPVWNLLDQDYAQVSISGTAGNYYTGLHGLYLNGSYVNLAREQWNVYPTSSGEAYDTLNETCMRVKLKIFTSTFPENTAIIIQEWAAGADPARISAYRLTGNIVANYHSGNVSCSSAELCETGAELPINQWFEMIVYHKFSTGSDGRIVWKIKTEGGSEQTLIDYSGKTRYGAAIDVWNPLKRYCPYSAWNNIAFVYDDFTIFDPALVNPTLGLPAWTIN